MFEDKKITFIGGGAMAQAIIGGVIQQSLVKAENITASDPVVALGEMLISTYGIRHTTDNTAAIAGADIVVLAIKPQYADDVFAELHGKIGEQVLVLSIMAGVTIERMRDGLKSERIIRVMPNTPAQIGQGISVWMATDAVDAPQRNQAQAILRAMGKEISVDREHYLDMTTAISGSGPAYVFLFLEALTDAGVHLGFSRPVAQELALQTIEGSAAFIREKQANPVDLRNMVTSPGGTTAEALYYLEKGGFRATISRAVYAAYQKSISLGRSKNS